VAGLILLGILSLGADQLVGRFKTDAVGTDLRFRLWRDGWHLFTAHPFGIGRRAFDRVFPIYRSLKMPFPLRFAFLENEPLQLLIDCGWLFAALIVGVFAYMIARLVASGRRDPVEAALCAGLAAVLTHGLVDFGLETMGVLLPFCAVLGTLFGRIAGDGPSATRRLVARPSWIVAGATIFGLTFGAVATTHGSNQDFDARLKRVHDPAERLSVLAQAERTHPLDYFYALERARVEPLAGSPSPRLHALNRALRLCPSCETVHAEVGRNLWVLGLRRQALLEWRTAVNLQPRLLPPTLGELYSAGARPEDLASVASGAPDRMLQVVDFLRDRHRLVDATKVLDEAAVMGAPRSETLLERGWLQFQAGDSKAAAESASAAEATRSTDPRLPMLQAEIILKTKGEDGADQAIRILDSAALRAPTDLALQRERMSIVLRYKRWKAASRALDGLKFACYHASGSAAEAHIAAAEVAAGLGRLTESVEEYRMALVDRPTDVRLWVDYGRAAEAVGRDAMARDAYAQAARLSPNSADVKQAQQALEERQARLRAILREAEAAAPSP
jgi:Flp pilus assembly protein TadD